MCAHGISCEVACGVPCVYYNTYAKVLSLHWCDGCWGSPGHATYHNVEEYTPADVSAWRLDYQGEDAVVETESANIIITKADLDSGVGTNITRTTISISSMTVRRSLSTDRRVYSGRAHGTAVAGQVLGQKLGGKADSSIYAVPV